MKNLVFIVEDNPVQQKMLQVHFEQALGNYTVKTFPNPEGLFAHLDEKPFAVVLDHFFGDSNGRTGLDYLKKLKKTHSSIPVIYYTSSTDENIKSEALKLGADQFITKDSASLVRLRTALDLIHEGKLKKPGFFSKLFGKD
jgi:DNA-binding response OmpR family regulator